MFKRLGYICPTKIRIQTSHPMKIQVTGHMFMHNIYKEVGQPLLTFQLICTYITLHFHPHGKYAGRWNKLGIPWSLSTEAGQVHGGRISTLYRKC